MPIRKFCDLCDSLIPEAHRSFRLDMSELDSPEVSPHNRRDFNILIGTNWEYRSPSLAVSLVCSSCAKSVIQHIYAELKKSE